jgi:hypothetical protein
MILEDIKAMKGNLREDLKWRQMTMQDIMVATLDNPLILHRNKYIGMCFIYLNPADAKKWNKFSAKRIYI